jgi:hypothetical protein
MPKSRLFFEEWQHDVSAPFGTTFAWPSSAIEASASITSLLSPKLATRLRSCEIDKVLNFTSSLT